MASKRTNLKAGAKRARTAKRVSKRGTSAAAGRTFASKLSKSAGSGRSVAPRSGRRTAKRGTRRDVPVSRDRDPRSTLEIWKSMGFIGCLEGPSDLSTNPKYMEGFGAS
jgi:hypothetical protein